MSGTRMDDWMDAARDDLAQRAPDAIVEAQLLARVRERGALRSVEAAVPVRVAPKRRPWWLRLSVGVPLAAAAVFVVLLGTRLLVPPSADPAMAAHEVATPFIALVAGEALAAERAPVVVASQVPRTALADYGLPVDPARADEPVDAEFLMSRTGVVLAVRFRE
jgi:hypothetical protein